MLVTAAESLIGPIYPMLTNATTPTEQWQFRYEPLLLPEFKPGGELALITDQDGDGWTTSLRMYIGTPEANQLAYLSLIKAYPSNAAGINQKNVSHLRIEEIGFDFEPPVPGDLGRLVTKPFNPGAAPSVSIALASPSREAATKLEAWLRSPRVTLRCVYKFNTRAIQQGAVSIKMSDLRGTKLEAALNGIPDKDEGNVYVRRHDLRRLSEGLHRQIQINQIFQDPALVDSDILQTLLDRWNDQITIDLIIINDQK